MRPILLDTNIVIYILKGDATIIAMLENLGNVSFSISIITWIEVLSGSFRQNKNISELAQDMEIFKRLPLDETIGVKAAHFIQKRIKMGNKRNFNDAIIAATACNLNVPLITNNPKGFRQFKELKIISPNKV
ncbi:type II toxin-antitoxin system VapC family toxin [Candidatus Peregrinibacteria bacterium]|nr:type II toxin-antitoxin system VapC family toxin [Candidatus Peregrinibacteria bacterium]